MQVSLPVLPEAAPAAHGLDHRDIAGLVAVVAADMRLTHHDTAATLATIASLQPGPAVVGAAAELMAALQRAADLAVLLRHAAAIDSRR